MKVTEMNRKPLTDYDRYIRSKFRVKIKSLAEEARIIRHEEARTPDPSWRGCLRGHRIHELRRESRSAQLAYAFVRGVPYKVVENRCKEDPDLKRIKEIVGSLSNRRVETVDVYEWICADVMERAA